MPMSHRKEEVGILAGSGNSRRKGVFRSVADWVTGKSKAQRIWEREWAGTVADQLESVSAAVQGAEDATGAHMERAIRCMREGDAPSAFRILVEAKKHRRPVWGLDHLRAVCFIMLNRIDEARESLLEELRFFPDNSGANALLDQVARKLARGGSRIGDREFQDLLQEIRPYTMLSEERLHSLYALARRACEDDIPGNFVECGVAGGGSSALLAAVIKRHSRRPRILFSFDTFEGMPSPTADDTHGDRKADDTGWGTGTCAAPESSVREACSRLGAGDVIETVRGHFRDTLPGMRDRVGVISLLHMDADWYESTRDILENLYDQIGWGGLVQVDDFGYWEGCAKAIREFEAEQNLRFEMQRIDACGVWFVKPGIDARPRAKEGN